MKSLVTFVSALALAQTLTGTIAVALAAPANAVPPRPAGPCDVYADAGAPCVAAHSTTRALYAAYNGPLYQVMRQSDGKTLDIGVIQPKAASISDAGGYADAAAQDRFCANTYCWITVLYDQSGKHNDLVQAPRGTWTGPALGGMDTLPVADWAPVTVMGHKVYGLFIAPGMGLRQNDPHGTPVDDQAGGQYWVINGQHYNSSCCFDYGNGEIDSIDDDNGTMEAMFYGNVTGWGHGNGPGPWFMTDQENNLVGCVNADKSKFCSGLPSLNWRFVTGTAKGKPGHWATLAGDATQGALSVMFDGPRIDVSYDPMRKQGAIILGNGGDNSAGSQGTFYEGAMTAPGTYPSHETDQAVQANIDAARYNAPTVTIAPPDQIATPGLQTFTPLSSRDVTVSFTNTSGQIARGVSLSVQVPKGWTAVVSGPVPFADAIGPGASLSGTFKVTSGATAFNGDLKGVAIWKGGSETAIEKVRNVAPVKINEFRVSDGSGNASNAFIELYNAGTKAADISGWTFTQHGSREPTFSTVTIPARTSVAPRGFYVLGLANSGLVLAAQPGDTTLHVRNVEGIKPGDSLVVGDGAEQETRKVVSVGTAAGHSTPLWQPLPDGPVITVPAGSTNVPVTSTDGFKVGDKIALAYGTRYPTTGGDTEHYEAATVTQVGTAGNQAWLGLDAAAGSTHLQVTLTDGISAGDALRLDIDSVGHGKETVTVKAVGTAAKRSTLSRDAAAGATTIVVRAGVGFPVPKAVAFAPGKALIGTPGQLETVDIVSVGSESGANLTLQISPGLSRGHVASETVVEPGTGLELAAPLKFDHAANLPFSVRGTGLSFTPATKHAHSSNEPVLPLGSGIVLDKPLTRKHPTDSVVRVESVTTAGYQGKPNQWFGGPALSTEGGNMVLRDNSGRVVDSLNYGGLVDPWASEGYQNISGTGKSGCAAPNPGITPPRDWRAAIPGVPYSGMPGYNLATQGSTGRYPDGADSDSNCMDLLASRQVRLAAAAGIGATNLKVASVKAFAPGRTVVMDTGANAETLAVATVGTAGATKSSAAADKGATVIRVTNAGSFSVGQAVVIDSGVGEEAGVIAALDNARGAAQITLTEPLKFAHDTGIAVSGTGITFTHPMAKSHSEGAPITLDIATPGAPNTYTR